MVLLLAGCNKTNNDKEVHSFQVENSVNDDQDVDPPKDERILPEEQLKILLERDPVSHFVSIFVIAEKDEDNRLLTVIEKNNMGDDVVIKNKSIYYSKNIPDYINDEVSLWQYNTTTGKEKPINTSTSNGFSVSEDEKYICYTKNKYSKETNWGKIYIPALFIKNLVSQDVFEFDLSESILRNQYGISTSMVYDAEINAFYIEFSQDAPGNIGKGYIHLDSMMFELLED